MFELVIDKRKIGVRRREKITAGSVGIRTSFEFSQEWNGLGKTAVFETDKHKIAVALNECTVTVPWEVCEEAGLDVIIGVYGTNADGSIVIPTVWAKLDTVSPGADTQSADNSQAPTATELQQILSASAAAVDAARAASVSARSAAECAADVKARADNGEFNGRDGINGINGRDYDHSAEFTRLSEEMTAYAESVNTDKAAITGSVTQAKQHADDALNAKTDAQSAKAAAETAAIAARAAADSVPELKEDLVNSIAEIVKEENYIHAKGSFNANLQHGSGTRYFTETIIAGDTEVVGGVPIDVKALIHADREDIVSRKQFVFYCRSTKNSPSYDSRIEIDSGAAAVMFPDSCRYVRAAVTLEYLTESASIETNVDYELKVRKTVELKNNIEIKRVSDLESSIADIIAPVVTWELGGTNTVGALIASNNRCRTKVLKNVTNGVLKVKTDGASYKHRIVYYNSASPSTTSFALISDWSTEDEDILSNYPYFIILSGRNDNASIADPDIMREGFSLVRISKDTFDMEGMMVSIIGDSISTNGDEGENHNAAEITVTAEDVGKTLSAYPTYYDVQNDLVIGGHTFTSSEIGTEVTFVPAPSDIGKSIGVPNKYNPNSTFVWWEVAKEKLGFDVNPVCWSGSSITSHEKNNAARKCSWAWHESQLRKVGIRKAGSMERSAPDVIIIYRGTNDMTHEPYTKLTDDYFDSVNFAYPVNDSLNDGYGFKEGLVLTIAKLRERYPSAKIVLCTLNVFKRINYSHFPTNNGINTLPQYNNAIREVADYMGCGLIEFDKDGITFENCYSDGYITDSPTTPTHPSNKGHMVMGLKAVADLKAHFSKMS